MLVGVELYATDHELLPISHLANADLPPNLSASPFLYFKLEHSAMICIPYGRRVGTGESLENHIRGVHRLKGKEFTNAITFSRRLIAANEITPCLRVPPCEEETVWLTIDLS